MQTIRDLDHLRKARAALTGRVAVVPTMGALHAGHLALVAAAKARADQVVATIFVNPTQFGPNEDLARYPRPEAADAAMLQAAGVAILWHPDVATMYPDGFSTKVSVAGFGDVLDGAARPGHFDGVATVVAKLFGQVRPDLAFFGEKDWQQLAVIRRMTIDLDLGIEIVGVPTEREADGLARSSRNAYLSHTERAAAPALPQALCRAVTAIEGGVDVAQALTEARADITQAGFGVDYVALIDDQLLPMASLSADGRIVAAARIGTTRLIDNLAVSLNPARR
ncbi:pantoate--beta-alanine ligase [Sphingomonas sp.]|uniref:pantoate--beta-alanine ligase n=1 Tax=Sphingomonas sp. TaxID=28214 RepID=UPI0025DA23BB|nr:pantoate--beta-alanine ligase [Sphingomonas sp.]